MSGTPKAIPGNIYGHLTLIEDSGKRTPSGDVIWKCQCSCGNIVQRSYSSIVQSLIKGCVISCGCKRPTNKGKHINYTDEQREAVRESLGQIEGTTIVGISEQKIRKNNKSGVRGVCFKSRDQKWQADITLRGKALERQLFKTKEEAIKWRKYLEEKYYEPIIERYNNEKNRV